jgi:enoyl-CoA hydratase
MAAALCRRLSVTARTRYELADGIATITLDDGKANALSPAMLAELNGALDRAQADKALVVLTGREGMFSAGFDLGVMGRGGEEAFSMLLAGFRLAERLLSFPKPVVIACSGHALAMGVFLVLSGDERIGVEGAFKIGANEVAICLTMPYSAVEICRQRLAPAHFQRAVNNAEIYAPAEAVAAGFLDRLVPASELAVQARAAAVRLARLNQPAHAASKLRSRAHSLAALRQAIEADADDLRALTRLR